MMTRLLKSLCAGITASAVLMSSACSSSKSSPRARAENQGKGDGMSRVVFRDEKGRELKESDLAGMSGTFNWEVVGPGTIPTKAKELHAQGRKAGSAGGHDKALALFDQAHKEPWTGPTRFTMPPSPIC